MTESQVKVIRNKKNEIALTHWGTTKLLKKVNTCVNVYINDSRMLPTQSLHSVLSV